MHPICYLLGDIQAKAYVQAETYSEVQNTWFLILEYVDVSYADIWVMIASVELLLFSQKIARMDCMSFSKV